MVFWLVLLALGMALVCPWLDFGAHLAPFGLPLGPLGAPSGPSGLPWGSLGVPWVPSGLPWGAQGDFIGFVKKWTSNSEQMCLKYRACK